jgi:mono/diheme cytochrome c family protein
MHDLNQCGESCSVYTVPDHQYSTQATRTKQENVMPIWMRLERLLQAGIMMLVTLILLALSNVSIVLAQSSQTDIDELLHGEALAKTNCGLCHNVGLDGSSPNDKAPPFRTLSERRDIETIASMLVNKQSPKHTGMPQFTITPTQALDIAEWIYWIQPVAHGKRLVKENCSRCHAVGRDDDSSFVGALPFRDLSILYPIKALEEAFAERIETGHPSMPVFEVTMNQLRDMLAYIESIQKP